MTYTVASRSSRLALAQAMQVTGMLPGEFEILHITTKGDRDRRPVFMIDRRGIFEREVNMAVADGRADFAVHSMKDVPNDIPPGLVIACVPGRHAPNDVMVCRNGMKPGDIGQGHIIGTSSLRRAAQAAAEFPGADIVPVRGNVDTRISKLGEFDALILAQAGIERLGLGVSYTPLSVERFIPSPGQGCLAIVARRDNGDILAMLETISDAASEAAATAERALSETIQSGCRFPVGAYARMREGIIHLVAAAYDGDGGVVKTEQAGIEPRAVGKAAGRELLGNGADRFALKWRQKMEKS